MEIDRLNRANEAVRLLNDARRRQAEAENTLAKFKRHASGAQKRGTYRRDVVEVVARPYSRTDAYDYSVQEDVKLEMPTSEFIALYEWKVAEAKREVVQLECVLAAI